MHSAVFYGLLIVDGAGVPIERQEGLAKLRAATNAPIFGLYESELGKGVVGGPYSSQRRNGEQIAQAALAILGGATSESPRTYVVEFQSPVYDWRELRSWNIDEQRLPRGSEGRFRPPSLWEEHRVAIIATLGVVISQSGLITAHEDERRRPPRTMC